MTKIFKYRIYPNRKQEQKLLSAIELCRQLYNVALEQRIILYKQSRKPISCYDQIVYENLRVKNMMKNRYLAKSIGDVAWNGFCQMLRYKSAEQGTYALPVSPRDISQICSNCGEIVKKALWVRRHKCSKCGLDIDRDENAALNILKLGIEMYRRDYGNQRLGRGGVSMPLIEPRSPFFAENG